MARDTATTGIDGASPPSTLATAKSEHAIANDRPTPSRSMTAPATGNVIATATVVAPTVTAMRSTPPMSCAAEGSAVVTMRASSEPRKVAPSAATISAV